MTNLFQNTVVLSLKHRHDRRVHIKNELSKLNINFDFFDAVNGYEVPRGNSQLLPGEIGIKISHLEILQEAKRKCLESIFIFEDDAVLNEHAMEIIERNAANIPKNCTLLYLGGAHRGILSKIQGDVYRTAATYTTHAMWIHKSIYDEAVYEISKNENEQLDNCYALLQQRITACTFFPNIAWQRDDYSDIQSKFTEYGWLRN